MFPLCFSICTKAPPAAGATGPVLPVDIVVEDEQPTVVSTTVSGPVTPINTPDGPVFPGDLTTTTDATPIKPAAQVGGGAKSAPKPAATALYIKKAGSPSKSPSSGVHKVENNT